MKPSSVIEAPNVSRYSFGNADEELRKEAEMELMKTDEDSQDSEIPLTVLDNNDEDRLISPEVNSTILGDSIDTTLPSSMNALLPPLSVEKSPKVLQPIQVLPSPSPSLDPEPARISPEIHPYDPSSSQDPLNILAGIPASLVQSGTSFPSVIKREPEEAEIHSDIEDRTLKSPDRSFTGMMAPEQSLSSSTMTSILRSNQHVNTSLASSPVPTSSVLTFNFSDSIPRKPHRDIASRFARFGHSFAERNPSPSESRKSVVESSLPVPDSTPSEVLPQSSVVEDGHAAMSPIEESTAAHDEKPTFDELQAEEIDMKPVSDEMNHSIEETTEVPVEEAVPKKTEVVIEENAEIHQKDISDLGIHSEEPVEESNNSQMETQQYHTDVIYEDNPGSDEEHYMNHVENAEENGVDYAETREENEVGYTETLEEREVDYTALEERLDYMEMPGERMNYTEPPGEQNIKYVETQKENGVGSETPEENEVSYTPLEEQLDYVETPEEGEVGYVEAPEEHELGYSENLEEQELGYVETHEEQELGYTETPEEQPHSGIYNDDGEIPLPEESPQELYPEEPLFEKRETEHHDIIIPSDQPHSGIYNDDGEIPLPEQEQNHSLDTENYSPLVPLSSDRPSVDTTHSIAKKEELGKTERYTPDETKSISNSRLIQQHSTNVLDDLQRETGITLPVSVTRFVAQEVPKYTESELRREILNAEYRGKAKGKQLVVTVNVAMEALEKEKNRLEEQVKELESQMETVQAVRDRSKGRLNQ